MAQRAGAVLFLLLSASASAAEPRSAAKLWQRVSAWLNAEPVIKAQRVTAVAAVRAGIPTEQGEDLDQRLLDRASALRRRLLWPRDSDTEERALRPIYDALALSQFVQSLELKRPETRAEALDGIRGWKQRRGGSAPAGLAPALSAAELSGTALVKAGWGGYCRSLTAEAVADQGERPGVGADEETAKLDELLDGVRRSWAEKALPPAELARAHLLAGRLLEALARAPLATSERAEAGRAASAPPLAAELKAAASGPLPDFIPRTIYDKASPSVVLIMGSSPDGSGELGSGSLIGGSRVLTNAHVVIRESSREPWPQLRVYLKPAKLTGDAKLDVANPIKATARVWDARLDLAVLELESPAERPALALADPGSVSIGDRVAAIGHPEQGGLWTLTTGVVSSVLAALGGVEGRAAFQTDASINRGNSGGPLLNAAGDLVGVNTSMSRRAPDGTVITSVNFAVRSDVALGWLARAGVSSPGAAAAPAFQPADLGGAGAAAGVESAVASRSAKAGRKHAGPGRSAPVTITESKPFSRDELIQREIAEMEDVEKEMQDEVRRRR